MEEVWGDLEPTARGARPSAGVGGPDDGPGDLFVAVAWLGARLGATRITSVMSLVTVDSECCAMSRRAMSAETMVGLADSMSGVSD